MTGCEEVGNHVYAIVCMIWGCNCSLKKREGYVAMDLSPRGFPHDEAARILMEQGVRAHNVGGLLMVPCEGMPMQQLLNILRLNLEPQLPFY